MVAGTSAAIVAGTLVTGSGPHAGDENAPRLDFDIESIARVHGVIVMATIVTVHRARGCESRTRGRRSGRRSPTPCRSGCSSGSLQAAIGYIQYFNDLPVLLGGHARRRRRGAHAGDDPSRAAGQPALTPTGRVCARLRWKRPQRRVPPDDWGVRWGTTSSRACSTRLLLGLLAVLGVIAIADVAHAQDDVAIQVQVKDQQRDANGRADNQPLAGVSVTVLDGSGNEIATVVTDAKGVALIPVPGRADYTVRLDESTLPEGKELTADTPAEQQILKDQFITSKKIVNYFTGASQRVAESTVDKWAQRFADGVRLGLILAMCSVGLSLIFGTTGLTNFAHGEMVTFGAMVAWTLNTTGHAHPASRRRSRSSPAACSATRSTDGASPSCASGASA